MQRFTHFIRENIDRIAQTVRELAHDHGYGELADRDCQSWKRTCTILQRAMLAVLDIHGLFDGGFSPQIIDRTSTAYGAAREIMVFHCNNDVPITRFMGLLKIYRQGWIVRLRTDLHDAKDIEDYLAFTIRFFDRTEIMIYSDWTDARENEQLSRMRKVHEATERERDRFLCLFESLINPAIVLDQNLNIVGLNQAATKLLTYDAQDMPRLEPGLHDSDAGQPDHPLLPLSEVMPWLDSSLRQACFPDGNFRPSSFDLALPGRSQEYYSVSVSGMSSWSDHFTGYTAILDNISERVQSERLLSDERNRAKHYLDIVGTVVVALDASGTITLINKTGCDLLGFSEFELLGRNWTDMVLPVDRCDEFRDRLYCFLSDTSDLDTEYTGYVTTKSGERRLLSWNTKILRNEAGLAVGVLSSGTDITDQREIEDALAEKELWLRNTFLALGEAVLILTPDRVIIDANPAAEAMFQMSNKALCGSPVEILHLNRKWYKQFVLQSEEAFELGETAYFEYMLRRRNGQTFPTLNSVSLIKGDDGAPIGIVSVVRDISARKATEASLRRSEAKFRRIFESIHEGYLVATLNGTIEMVNPATCEMLGYEQNELINSPMSNLYRSQEERNRFVNAISEKGKVRGYHLSASRKDGSVITVEANAHVIFDDDNKPVAMEGTFRDITDRLKAEKLLREREKQYRAFFENNHAIMLLTDPRTGDIIDANPAAGDFYGYPLDTMRAMPLSDILALTEEEVYREMSKARMENRAYFIFKHRLADGTLRDVEVYSGPIMVRDSQLLYSVIHDVTERIRLEREMQRMATTDALTGAANRYQFFRLAETEFNRSRRYERPLCVIMLDIDYFKSINDTYGHQAGDDVLRLLSKTATDTLRESDIFGRLGGEEFAAFLPETGRDEAVTVADRLRVALSQLVVESEEDQIRFTVSVGVAMVQQDDKNIQKAINRADEALYKAKRSGRNRVMT